MNKSRNQSEGFGSDIIIKVARMYYNNEMKQNDIADALNLTQSRVSMILKEAVQRGFVKIAIEPPKHKDIENEIISLYPHIKEVVIVECQDDANLKAELGQAAANYFGWNVKNEDAVAISCGTTIGSMINYLTPNKYSILEAAPLLITGVGKMVGWTPVSLISKLISKYDSPGVIGYGYQLPPFIDAISEQGSLKEYYLGNKFIKKALEKASGADITFISIGIVHQKHRAFEFSKFIEEHHLEDMVYRSEAIGEICYQPFDRDGNILIEKARFEDLRNRFIYVPIQQLVEKARSDYYRVVAVAGGKTKAEVIKISLKMKCYNVLICDVAVAENLCNQGRG